MSKRPKFTPATLTLLCLAVALPASSAPAQEKQHVSFKALAENSKFTQQLNIDVGDRPNHIVRIFEAHGTFPTNAPIIDGLKVVDWWVRGIGDRVEGNGPATQYNEFVMENGDKFYARVDGLVQNTSTNLTSTQVGYITGGTGRFATIRGIIRATTNFNYNTGFNENQFEIEYSTGK
jgi:hypothetical protein